jgi:tRNA dimethylallyltransferase
MSVICLMGPTASGKTKLAIELAQKFPCEIISVDSGMIYRGMDIGTAKPTPEELVIAPHHLIDILDPIETYSAAQFRTGALQAISDILAKGKIPLLVGGTMLYFKILQQGISKLPSADAAIRAKLAKEEERFGLMELYKRLLAIDPVAAQRIQSNDAQRIQRALEVYELSGKTMTEWFSEENMQPLPYKSLNLIIAPAERSALREKITKRLDLMFQYGFVAEVEKLYARGDLHPDLPSMRAVGYRQIWQYLTGEIIYDTMRELINIATNQLAKRQLTWLRSWQNSEWFDSEDSQLYTKIASFIRHVK